MEREKRKVKIPEEILRRIEELNQSASELRFDPVRDGRYSVDDYTGTVYNDIKSLGCTTSGRSSEDNTIRLIVLGNCSDNDNDEPDFPNEMHIKPRGK